MTNVDFKRFVRHFYDPPPKNEDASGAPIWCLGQAYRITALAHPEDVSEVDSTDSQSHSEPSVEKSSPPSDASIARDASSTDISVIGGEIPKDAVSEGGWPSAFLDDFESRIWMTYRSGFPPIPKSQDPKASASITFAVRLRNLGETEGFSSDTGWGCMIRSGQSLLANTLIMLHLGRGMSGVVKHLASEHKDARLNVYVTNDSSDVYEDKFREVACSGSDRIRPTLILLGIRLGIDRVTPVYWEALKGLLQYPQSVGIAGGRPSASHYFVGTQNSNFFYLDPHDTRPALPYHSSPEDYSAEELETCHTRRLRCLHIKDMDPSMLIGFLIRDEDDWSLWKKSISDVQGKPIIHVFDKEPASIAQGVERESALDEVETFDDEDDDATETGE
ncbi:MAG: hypothetical protein Q9227_001922 [Pyrenula ochraceoflavens]